MYHFIEDKKYLRIIRRECSDAVNRLVTLINNDSVMKVEMHIVGSGAKNLETQNENEPIDLDYNLNIIGIYEVDINDCKSIKEYVRMQFNKALKSKGWKDCQDSTSALTTEKRHITEDNKTLVSIDLAIVVDDGNRWYRLIHDKTGFVQKDRWFWNEGPSSYYLFERVNLLKETNLWEEVREVYLNKKNFYLSKGTSNEHPSFNCYIEAVNEVYNKYKH